ncbi:aspartic proteinase CDR1-like [Ananas comosus]|uniref:Aspartic proteinase CDR1-like n=1 Tax=Ananas comosus TaxID=4615 RepID=A0A6P5GGS1_ANACO|nr:aspartic proteinase CDR1-like [Ananas comosus]
MGPFDGIGCAFAFHLFLVLVGRNPDKLRKVAAAAAAAVRSHNLKRKRKMKRARPQTLSYNNNNLVFYLTMSPLNLLIYFSLLLHSSYAQLITGEKGFSLELIHIDSKRSPLYDANLTDFQRIVRSIDYSKSRVLWLESMMIARANPTVIRPPLRAMPPAIFMVAVSIGSGNGLRNYYLHMDTGSSLTWTQCLPCRTGFPQSAPKFDPRLSDTYHVVGCDDPVCKPPRYKCVNNRCEYNIRYFDNTFIDGVLSKETFSFQDAHASHRVAIRNLFFGCTHSSNMNYHENPAGIFGMSRNPTSTVKQLATRTDGLFSYCFFPPETAHTSFLRFGHDIRTPRGGFQRHQFQRAAHAIPERDLHTTEQWN